MSSAEERAIALVSSLNPELRVLEQMIAHEIRAAEEAARAKERKPMACGHPLACVVSSSEGTNYCGACADVGKARAGEREAHRRVIFDFLDWCDQITGSVRQSMREEGVEPHIDAMREVWWPEIEAQIRPDALARAKGEKGTTT